MTKNNPPILLTEAFKDWAIGKGIFSEMENVPWEDDADADLLDLDYFGNHSGWKKCAPLVYHLMSDDHTLVDAMRKKLADLVVTKFGPNWTALWNTYHAEYDPLVNYDITETGNETHSDSSEKGMVHTASRDDTDSTSTVHGEQISESGSRTDDETIATTHGEHIVTSGSTTQDDDTVLTHGEEIAVSETGEVAETNSRYGFNSSDAVPVDSRAGNSENSSTTIHSGEDTTERDFSESKSGSETHSGTDSVDRDLSATESKTTTHSGTDTNSRIFSSEESSDDTHTHSGEGESEYEKHFSGVRDINYQKLIQEERALWIEDFFTRVYIDIDTVLASMIYNREHRVRHPYIWGYGYYSI